MVRTKTKKRTGNSSALNLVPPNVITTLCDFVITLFTFVVKGFFTTKGHKGYAKDTNLSSGD